MALDQPATSAALWDLYAATGVRPEFLIPMFSFESGLNPASSNSLGYSGLNGIASAYLTSLGLTEAAYVTWSASEQIAQVIEKFFAGVVATYGPLTSGIRVYQGNFYPASLAYAPGLDDAIVKAPSAAYEANVVFDPARKGAITPRDLGSVLAQQLDEPAVQAGIAAAYADAPASAGPMQDPVFGAPASSPAAAPASASNVTGLVVGAAIASVVSLAIGAAWNALVTPRARTA
jgi:hypothetical protein